MTAMDVNSFEMEQMLPIVFGVDGTPSSTLAQP